MAHVVLVMERAQADIAAGVVYRIQRGSESVARRWESSLLAAIETLAESPNRCPLATEATEVGLDLRELQHGHRRGNVYRILFVVDGAVVRVLRVRHAAQDRLRGRDL